MPRDGEGGEPRKSVEELLRGKIIEPESNLFCHGILSSLGEMSVLEDTGGKI